MQYQLFAASTSKNIKAQRTRTFILLMVACGFLSYLFFTPGDWFSYLLVTFFGLVLIFYKWYEKSRYTSHYRRHIADNYKERFGLISTLTFTEHQIIEENKLGESKINYESLSAINETGDYYFLKLITGQSLIIPKRVLADIRAFHLKLEDLKSRFNLKNKVDLNWKWK